MPDPDEYPDDRRYTAQHQWIMADDDGGWRVGITRFSYDRLDAVLSLELPEAGEWVEAGQLYGHIQSLVGPLQELYAPVSGKVLEVNAELLEDPEAIFVADDPYGDGWMLRVRVADRDQLDPLLDAAAYDTLTAAG